MEQLQKRIAELEQELKQEQDYREFEQNKYEVGLATQRSGIAKHLKSLIDLEILSLRELAGRVQGDDQRKIIRRLDRIEEELDDFIYDFSN